VLHIDFPLFSEADNEGDDESECMDWHVRNTRKFIGRPISPSSEFERTVRICFMSFSFIYLIAIIDEILNAFNRK
jgi:hypothetical protein